MGAETERFIPSKSFQFVSQQFDRSTAEYLWSTSKAQDCTLFIIWARMFPQYFGDSVSLIHSTDKCGVW